MLVGMRLGLVALVGTFALAKQHAPFSAVDMLSTPRPQPGIASPNGQYALSVVDQWDPEHDKTTRSVYIISLNTTKGSTGSDGFDGRSPIPLFQSSPGEATDLLWLNDQTLAYLNDTTLYSLSVRDVKVEGDFSGHRQELLRFPDSINPSGLQYERNTGNLIFSGQVWYDGAFENTGKGNEEYENRGTTGVVYDELFIRHWDTWRTPGKVWTIGLVHLDQENHFHISDHPSHPPSPFINLLNGTNLTSKMDPHGSISISKDHIAFTVKNPYLNLATHTREDVYLIPLSEHLENAGQAQHLTPHDHGAISSVKFSPDGKKIGWLEMAEDGYESDKRVIVVHTLSKKGLGQSEQWVPNWDRSPSEIVWSLDSESLYFTAEHHGRILPYHLTHPDHLPTPLLFEHSTTTITPLSNTSLLLGITSLTSPADNFILDLDPSTNLDLTGDDDADKSPNRTLHAITSWSKHHIDGRLDGLEIEDLWFKGADDWDVMAWVIKPPTKASYTTRGKDGKLPLAFFVHGGPQGSWEDAWSTRWNPALFAANGYFVVAVNPTGSTGYGQEFCDKIKQNWGGAPFKDLLAGFQATIKKYPEIDRERTAMLGASYGGYMANWIQGHNDQFRFKAIICHDGIFDTTSAFYETEEVWFPQREFGGDPTAQRALFEKWNPMNHVSEWKTPELVIHGGKDYRLVDGQGIAAFTALQVQGVPSRFLYFPDENHWVLKASNSRKWHHEVFRWLNEWTGVKSVKEGTMKEEKTPALVVQS